MPQLPRPCQRFSNGFEPIHLIKSEQLPGSDGGSGSITIQVITEEEDGGKNLDFSSGLSSSMNAGDGAVAEQDFIFSPSYSRPFSVKRSDIPAPSQPLSPGIYTINYDVPPGLGYGGIQL